MKRLLSNCIDCGSQAVNTLVDEVKPIYKMELVSFGCGATLKTIFTSNGNVGKVLHSGCMQEGAITTTF